MPNQEVAIWSSMHEDMLVNQKPEEEAQQQ